MTHHYISEKEQKEMNKPIIQVKNLSHRYSKNWAIRNISFEISQTGIVGLLGSNGAGKSTTMNIICGALNQTEGDVRIADIDLRKHPEEAKKQIGFLPQNAPLHLDLTVDEYLVYCAHIRLIEKHKVRRAVELAKERCGVAHFSNRLIRNLSGGYRQRVGIAQAIIHLPRLVVLDEPTNGLDPNQILEVRKLIKEISIDRAVIFSSHILSEVQVMCREIKMIENGNMVFADTMEAFNNYLQPHSLRVYLDNPPKPQQLTAIPEITEVIFLSEKEIRLQFNPGADITEYFIRLSIEKGWHLKEIVQEKSSMEDIFAQLSKKAPK
jgi:ABC-2 type transport system ATP-binding protein